MSDKLFQLVAEVMNIDVSEINENSGPDTIENWDSFNGFVLVDKLETEFNVQFTLDEIIDVKIISDIKKYLKNHGVNFDG
jgi:acyl carrier protein